MLLILRKFLLFSIFFMAISPLYANTHKRSYSYNKKYMAILIESIAKSKLGKNINGVAMVLISMTVQDLPKRFLLKQVSKSLEYLKIKPKWVKRFAKINFKREISSFFTPRRVKLSIMLVSI